MPLIKILAVGDVVGEGGVSYLSGGRLRSIQSRLGAVFTVVNGENSSKANCITPESAEALFEAGADVLVAGSRVFRAPDPMEMIKKLKTTPIPSA